MGDIALKNSSRALFALIIAVCGLPVTAFALEPDVTLSRGEYLTKIMDCGACHTPWKLGPSGPQPDASKYLSGHPQETILPPPPLPDGPWNAISAGNTAWAGPWGISYSTNLTPDKETGIGGWSEKMFAGSMRTGKHAGLGRDVLPPMPRYPEITDEDLHAIFSYLKSLTPINNRVPAPVSPNPEG